MIKTRIIEDLVEPDSTKSEPVIVPNTFNIPKSFNKYIPHQGNNEKWRRLMKIVKSHPTSCHCPSCEYAMVQTGTQD